MRVEILTIGREILDGRVIDTNSVYLALKLKEKGLVPRHAQKVDDDPSRMIEAFGLAQNRSDIVLVTGGLGPTADDLTAAIFSDFLGKKAKLHLGALEEVKGFFDKVGRPFTTVQEKQAYLPPGSQLLKNRWGSAPGFWIKKDKTLWFFMPGVPQEMKNIFENEVLALLPELPSYRTYTWVTQFTSEGELQSLLEPVQKQLGPQFELSFRTRFPENHIGLYGFCDSTEEKRLFEDLLLQITFLLKGKVFSEGPEIENLELVVFKLLKKRAAVLTTVESCTGGLIAHRMTDIPGSSEVFWGSDIVYDNKMKLQLGLSPEKLENFGAVSEEVAKELAELGLKKAQNLKKTGPIYCLSTTGIAGPTGASSEKPVGLCFIALACDHAPTQTLKVQSRVGLERSLNKIFFSQKALDLLRRALLL